MQLSIIIIMKYYLLAVFLFMSLTNFAQTKGAVEIDSEASVAEKWGFLEQVLKGKKIVALGETLHGIKEQNATKLELIKYLHEELGFNVLAMEADVAENYYGNLYKTEVKDTTLLKELFMPVWHTPEHLAIIQYVQSKPNLHIIGFDVEVKQSALKIGQLLDMAIDTTSDAVQEFQQKYAQWREVNGRYPSSVEERDSTMAEIVQWIVDDLYQGEKVIVSGHNHHISNKVIIDACMGELLKKKYGKDYYSLGFYYSVGTPKHALRSMVYEMNATDLYENTVQAKFLETGKEQLYLNIKQLRGRKPYKWLFKDLEDMLHPTMERFPIRLSRAFDGLFWIKEVTYPTYIIPNKYFDR